MCVCVCVCVCVWGGGLSVCVCLCVCVSLGECVACLLLVRVVEYCNEILWFVVTVEWYLVNALQNCLS